MTSSADPAQGFAPGAERLRYIGTADEQLETSVTVDGSDGKPPEFLLTRSLRLGDGRPVHQLLVDPAGPKAAYERLDNEILAGLRLIRKTRSLHYPGEVSHLIGYNPDPVSPFALLQPYRGDIVSAVAGHLVPASQYQFEVSLLTGLRWLAEAGVAHCNIGPSTVRWDGERVQITDFSRATVIGASRQFINMTRWTAASLPDGQVSEGDDMLAAGLLIYYVLSGEELTDPGKLAEWQGLGDLLAGVFKKDPRQRPSARELLTQRLGVPDPVPHVRSADPQLERGRREFTDLRLARHPEVGTATSEGLQSGQQAAGGDPDVPTGRLRRLRTWIGGLFMVLIATGLVVWVR